MQNTQKMDWLEGVKCWDPFLKKLPFFHKKVPFLVNNKRYPKFLEYALQIQSETIRKLSLNLSAQLRIYKTVNKRWKKFLKY